MKIDTTMDIISSSGIDGGKPAMFISRPPKKTIDVTVGEDVSISFRVNGIPKPRGKNQQNFQIQHHEFSSNSLEEKLTCLSSYLFYSYFSNVDEGIKRHYRWTKII